MRIAASDSPLRHWPGVVPPVCAALRSMAVRPAVRQPPAARRWPAQSLGEGSRVAGCQPQPGLRRREQRPAPVRIPFVAVDDPDRFAVTLHLLEIAHRLLPARTGSLIALRLRSAVMTGAIVRHRTLGADRPLPPILVERTAATRSCPVATGPAGVVPLVAVEATSVAPGTAQASSAAVTGPAVETARGRQAARITAREGGRPARPSCGPPAVAGAGAPIRRGLRHPSPGAGRALGADWPRRIPPP